MDTFVLEQPILHKKLGLVGIVLSEVPVVTHVGNLQRKQVNVRLVDGDETFDLWWDATMVEPTTAGISFNPPLLDEETSALAPALVTI